MLFSPKILPCTDFVVTQWLIKRSNIPFLICILSVRAKRSKNDTGAMNAVHHQKILFFFSFLWLKQIFYKSLYKFFQSQIGRHMASSTMYGQSMLTNMVGLEIFCLTFQLELFTGNCAEQEFLMKKVKASKYVYQYRKCKFDYQIFKKLYLFVSMMSDIKKIPFSHVSVFNCCVLFLHH